MYVLRDVERVRSFFIGFKKKGEFLCCIIVDGEAVRLCIEGMEMFRLLIFVMFCVVQNLNLILERGEEVVKNF